MSEIADPDLPPSRHVTTAAIVAVRGGTSEARDDRLVGEAPLEIRAAGPGQEPVTVAVTMRTPGHEAELAAGFLRSEGLIAGDDIAGFEVADPSSAAQPDDTLLVRLDRPFDAALVPDRHFVATASCGICGKASIDAVAVRSDPIGPGPTVRPDVLVSLPGRMRQAQAVFEATGGLHAAALFTPDGDLLALREDVGRHNALDKLIGSQLLAGSLPLRDRIVLVSGRVSFELVQKAAVAGAPILCAVSAPSDLAVEAADRLGLTVVGFLRGDGFNVYSHPERVLDGSPSSDRAPSRG
jgi:FdhD protein